jgi:hypothetical protein
MLATLPAAFSTTTTTTMSTSVCSSSASSSPDSAFAPRYGDATAVSVEVIRCMRCARAVEATSTDDMATTGMVRIATGLYYCGSCAANVGFQT